MLSNQASPPRADGTISAADLATCRRFSEALANRNVPAALAEAHPAIALHTPRRVLRGANGVRTLLASAAFDHLEQTILIDDVVAAGRRALSRARMELRWRDNGELADSHRVSAFLDVRDGRVVRWQPTVDGA